ncbi:MAG: tRNA uridine-5-carboxymethylaminomethyl(34) synthesis enzyme MnmG [Candidatus Eisenbacteria bacterium]|nr:tRNA uridine-5-carboxymethylaminomethyl(34) synthesis enzyme MnmG [Candidatus Eisenbacteria bacterium]
MQSQVGRAYDAVVIGGGHAGIEAAWALGRLGHSVALVSFEPHRLGRMSCNPSIGGLAKGQLVREIDALGGLMGRLIDRTGIHFRMLNRRKGPAVHAPRAQADKRRYQQAATAALAALPGVTRMAGEVTEIVTEARGDARRVVGVRIAPVPWGRVTPGGAHSHAPRPPAGEEEIPGSPVEAPIEIATGVVIVTAGTFLGARLFTGLDPRPGGRRGEPPADPLSRCLAQLGLQLGRLKTGTPPRLRGNTIDFARLEAQPGEEPPPRFSHFDPAPVHNQVVCHLTRTNARTHRIIAGSLDGSPLFGGMIRGVGPRYCPSIEDKVVRFPDRRSHQIFLEPEGLKAEEIYPNGISTSLPESVQEAYVRSIEGLEEAEIIHPGYAVEYDFVLTSHVSATLAVDRVAGLYMAGQVNGTSGYEEAAAQGLVAGVNAAAELTGRDPFVLRRHEAYIGVLIDDLVTKIPTEPYRMFTSQSEFRLLLRQDNADLRLSDLGRERGLLSKEDGERVRARRARLAYHRGRLGAARLGRGQIAELARGAPDARLAGKDAGRSAEDLLRRPGVTVAALQAAGILDGVPSDDATTLEADVKYAGYVARQEREVAQRRDLEETPLPRWLRAEPPADLSREAREKILQHRPRTLGEASRIPGVTPCDVSLLAIRIRAGREGAAGAMRASGVLPEKSQE